MEDQKQFFSSFELFKRGMTLGRLSNIPAAELEEFVLSLERKPIESVDDLFTTKHPETEQGWDTIAYYEQLLKSSELTKIRLYEQLELDRFVIRDHMNTNIKLQEQNKELQNANQKLKEQLLKLTKSLDQKTKENVEMASKLKNTIEEISDLRLENISLSDQLSEVKEKVESLSLKIREIPKSNYEACPPWDLNFKENVTTVYQSDKPDNIDENIWKVFSKYQNNDLLDFYALHKSLTTDIIWPPFTLKTLWIMIHQADQTGQYVDINGFNKLWLFVHSMYILMPKSNKINVSDAIRIIKGYGFKSIWINRVINRTIGNPECLTWDQLLQVSSILLCWWEVINLKLSGGVAIFEYDELMGIATKLLF
ncbi:hypothetical protein HDV06_003212 [Boothiomyces sp. JEL0866]|nr:hypothetical protein HDV06_003212 [Boothiomyces sp. JEL0866]